MLKIATTLCALAVIAGSIPMSAARQEIDQSVVRSEGGFPYKIKKSGSYKLTSNLVIPAGKDGIDVMASDVTIDLNGFGIIGPVVCSGFPFAVCPAVSTGIGIRAGEDEMPGPSDVKVMDGFVRGMGSDGISLTGDGSLVSKVSAQSNAGTGIIVSGTVSESSAINNGETGILAIIVSNSEAASNTGDGIDLDARGGVALNVVSSDNGKNGITVANGSVTGSTVTLNKGAGISAVCPSAILNNTIVTNATSIQTTQPGCVFQNNGTRP
jgi:hypothetical protein